MKANPTPLPRPPNQDILKHEQLRKIEVELYKKEKALKKEGQSEDQIKEHLSKLREELTVNQESLTSNPTQGHQQLFEKQKHMEKIKESWGISAEHKFGEAFDVDLQDQKRKAKLEEKEKKRKEEKR